MMRFASVGCLVVASACLLNAQDRDRIPQTRPPGTALEANLDPLAPFGAADEAAVDEVSETESAEEALRSQYLEQVQRKAALMSEEQLREAVETAAREIRELEAHQQLSGAKRILEQLVRTHEGTEAAQAAARMLDTAEEPAPETNPLPDFAPATSSRTPDRKPGARKPADEFHPL